MRGGVAGGMRVIGLDWGNFSVIFPNVQLEPGFSGLLRFSVGAWGLPAAGGVSVFSYSPPIGLGGGSLGEVSLGRRFAGRFSPGLKGLGICEKKARSSDSKGCCKTSLQWGFSSPQLGQASSWDRRSCCKLWRESETPVDQLNCFLGDLGPSIRRVGDTMTKCRSDQESLLGRI